MTTPNRFCDRVFQEVFTPTVLAYFWSIVGYFRWGLLLFLACMVWAYAVGLFKRVAEWPLIPKIALASSAPLIALGWYFSTQAFTYAMLVPGLIYTAVALVGRFALQRLE